MAEEIKNSATEEDYEPDLITLEDEDGQECTFEVIDATDYEGVHYLALVPYVENEEDVQDDAQLILMRVGKEDQGEFLDIVEDDEELYQVSKIFEKRLAEYFNIEQ